MSLYETIKSIHVATATLSICGFIVRGIWMMQSSARMQGTWVKVIPHINDTVLLLSAIGLVMITAQYPGPAVWLNAKIVALLIYIVLGTIALKQGKTMPIRIIAWSLAILVFAYILAVASSKNVLIF